MRCSIQSVKTLTASGIRKALAYATSKTQVENNAHVLQFNFDAYSNTDPLRLEIVFRVPVAGIHGLWSPFGSSKLGNQAALSWKHEMHAVQAGAFPSLVFVDRELKPVLFLCLMEHATETEWSVSLSQSDECYFITFSYPDSGYLPQAQWDEIAFYVSECSSKEERVFSAMERFTRYFASKSDHAVRKGIAPDSVYLPVFCTWYAAHAAVNREWVEKTAALAAELGFGQFIQDDGWQHDRFGRVTCTSDLKNWFAWSGDWTPSSKKFPDFAEHVAYLQSLGLKYILWWDPYGVGRYSKAYGALRNRLSAQRWEFEGRRYLCAQDEVVHDHILDTATRLVSDYGLDGFKVDFIYALDRRVCASEEHRHFAATVGHGIVRTMRDVLAAVLEMKPDFNMMHTGGPLWNSLSTSLRGIDVPLDADSNLHYLAYFKAFAGETPLQSDPLFWAKDDSVADAARHLISSVFYVPCLSMDILSMGKERLEMIRRWMEFYRENISFFRSANRRVQNVGPLIGAVSAEDGLREVIGVFRNVPVSIGSSGDIIVLNGSSGPDVFLRLGDSRKAKLEVFGVDFKSVSKSSLVMSGITKVDIPCGGYARLTGR